MIAINVFPNSVKMFRKTFYFVDCRWATHTNFIGDSHNSHCLQINHLECSPFNRRMNSARFVIVYAHYARTPQMILFSMWCTQCFCVYICMECPSVKVHIQLIECNETFFSIMRFGQNKSGRRLGPYVLKKYK